MAWEVVEKRDGYEVAYIWFSSRKKAEAFCIGNGSGETEASPNVNS